MAATAAACQGLHFAHRPCNPHACWGILMHMVSCACPAAERMQHGSLRAGAQHATLAHGYSVTTTGPEHVWHASACISGARFLEPAADALTSLLRYPVSHLACLQVIRTRHCWHSGQSKLAAAPPAPVRSQCSAGGTQRGGTCWHSGQLKLAAGSTAACVLPTQRGWNQSSHASHCTMYASGLYGSSHTQYLRARAAPRAPPCARLPAARAAPCRAPGRRRMHLCSGCTLSCCKQASALPHVK